MKPQISRISGDAEFDTLVNEFLDTDNLAIVEIGDIEHHRTGWTIEITLQASDGIYHYFSLYHNNSGYGFTCDSFESENKKDFWGVKKKPDGTHKTTNWD